MSSDYRSPHAATTCTRARPGPMYWDWRCLTCGQPVAQHPSLWRRLRGRMSISNRVSRMGAENGRSTDV